MPGCRRYWKRHDEHRRVVRSSPSDDELLHHSAKGDTAAFAQLYDRIAPPMFALLVRATGDHARTEALMQHTLVELWRTAAWYEPAHGSVLNWSLTLAHRQVHARPPRARRRRRTRSAPSA